jgi:hypothetical protein
MTPEQLAAAIATASRPRRTVPILLDGDVREQVDTLTDELTQLLRAAATPPKDKRLASRPDKARVDQIEAELEQLYERAEARTLHVVVEGLSGTAWRALVAQHPPRKGEDGKPIPEDAWGVNEETFQLPAIRACVIGHRPDPDSETVKPLAAATLDWLLTEFGTETQIGDLYAAVVVVCRRDERLPLRLPRSTTPTSGRG